MEKELPDAVQMPCSELWGDRGGRGYSASRIHFQVDAICLPILWTINE